MSAVGGNYISDGQIMAWLANQQDRIYGDLKESMDLAETRADFASELVEIKAHLEEANRNKDFGAVDQELQAFLEKYGSNPEFAEICNALNGMADNIHTKSNAQGGYAEKYVDYTQNLQKYENAVAMKGLVDTGLLPELSADHQAILDAGPPEKPIEPVDSYSKEQIEDWTTLIDDKLDASSKNDQLTMIHIQELKATLDQGVQMASSFIASGDKTTSAIINNLA